jgi:hypothetical protein
MAALNMGGRGRVYRAQAAALLHPADTVLAAGAPRAGLISADLASPAAASAGWHCCRRSLRTDRSTLFAAGKGAPRSLE